MKIAIDARFWGTPGGFSRYLEQIITRLATLDESNNYFIIVRNRSNLPILGPRFQYVELDIPWYSWQEQILIPWHLYRLGVDLIHFPHFNVPLLMRKKYILTIHDLIMIRFPSHKASLLPRWIFQIKYWAYQLALRNAVRQASAIITPSQWTKHDLTDYLRITPQNVTVIPEASNFSPEPPTRSAIRQLLYVGNCYPHKNVDFLCEAFASITAHDDSIQLKLIIPNDYFSQAMMRDIATYPEYVRSRIHVHHAVSDDQLRQCYRESLALVLPSKHEGFGLPGLEAMSCGLPVIASSSSCFPEIYGSAAYYFDPSERSSLITALQTVIRDSSLRDTLTQAGYQQAQLYSWQRAAQETLDLYLRT